MPDITITIPNDQVERLRKAFEFHAGIGSPIDLGSPTVGSPPTVSLADVKQFLITQLKDFVRDTEQMKAVAAVEKALQEAEGIEPFGVS